MRPGKPASALLGPRRARRNQTAYTNPKATRQPQLFDFVTSNSISHTTLSITQERQATSQRFVFMTIDNQYESQHPFQNLCAQAGLAHRGSHSRLTDHPSQGVPQTMPALLSRENKHCAIGQHLAHEPITFFRPRLAKALPVQFPASSRNHLPRPLEHSLSCTELVRRRVLTYELLVRSVLARRDATRSVTTELLYMSPLSHP